MLALVLLLAAAHPAAEGKPLLYWGARPPLVTVESAKGGVEARVVEVRAAIDKDEVVLRFDFDRPVREALYLQEGVPVSGRLRATLYMDSDDDRRTGYDGGPNDPRTGAEVLLDLGSVSVGGDPEEHREAQAIVAASLYSLARDGRRHTLWRGDSEAEPGRVSAHGEWVEVRLPSAVCQPGPRARLILATETKAFEGLLTR